MKKTYIWVLVILIILVGLYFFVPRKANDMSAKSEKDATYMIEGQKVKLTNGSSEMEIAPGSATKIVTKYFGNEAKYDFDGDGRMDVVFLLTQSTGGSGTFYYVVAGLNKADGFVGSSATFIGDRIAPQNTSVSSEKGTEGIVTVNYADRKPTDSFAVNPSVGKSMRLIFDSKTSQFIELK